VERLNGKSINLNAGELDGVDWNLDSLQGGRFVTSILFIQQNHA
jgi:hypothetical protein